MIARRSNALPSTWLTGLDVLAVACAAYTDFVFVAVYMVDSDCAKAEPAAATAVVMANSPWLLLIFYLFCQNEAEWVSRSCHAGQDRAGRGIKEGLKKRKKKTRGPE